MQELWEVPHRPDKSTYSKMNYELCMGYHLKRQHKNLVLNDCCDESNEVQENPKLG